MTGYLLEVLFPTGWRRHSQLHWRFADAERAAHCAIHQDHARGVRVLPVRVMRDAVLELTADQAEEAA
jgi:hypothetical protein